MQIAKSRPLYNQTKQRLEQINMQSGQSLQLTTDLHQAPRLRIRGFIPSLTHTSSWITFLLYFYHSHQGRWAGNVVCVEEMHTEFVLENLKGKYLDVDGTALFIHILKKLSGQD
jgi:hypothetical protein